jgi:hypothetical protein
MRLRLFIIAALVALAVPSTAMARTAKAHARDDQQKAAAIVGTWDVTVTPDGQPQVSALLTLTRGGGLIETESDFPGTGLGSWNRIGPDRYAFAIKTFNFKPTGEPNGWVIVRSRVTLSGGTLSGPFRFDVFDAAGNKVDSGGGTATAKPFVIPDVSDL